MKTNAKHDLLDILDYINRHPGCGTTELSKRFNETTMHTLRQRLKRMCDKKQIYMQKNANNHNFYFPIKSDKVKKTWHKLHKIKSIFDVELG